MNTPKTSLSSTAGILLISALALLLTSCSGVTKWWEGSWVLDREYTADQFKIARAEQRANQPVEGTGIGEFFSNLISSGTDEAILASLDGIALTITSTEFALLKNGNGNTQTYEILETPAPDKIVLKLADGSVLSLTKEGKYLTMIQGEGLPIRLYFLEVQK